MTLPAWLVWLGFIFAVIDQARSLSELAEVQGLLRHIENEAERAEDRRRRQEWLAEYQLSHAGNA
jgi:hypothetical protein